MYRKLCLETISGAGTSAPPRNATSSPMASRNALGALRRALVMRKSSLSSA